MDDVIKKVAQVYNREAEFEKRANDYKKLNQKMAKKLLPIDLGNAILKNHKVNYQSKNGKQHSRKIKNLTDFKKHFKVVPLVKSNAKSEQQVANSKKNK